MGGLLIWSVVALVWALHRDIEEENNLAKQRNKNFLLFAVIIRNYYASHFYVETEWSSQFSWASEKPQRNFLQFDKSYWFSCSQKHDFFNATEKNVQFYFLSKRVTIIYISLGTLFENYSKCRIFDLTLWHFPTIFCPIMIDLW